MRIFAGNIPHSKLKSKIFLHQRQSFMNLVNSCIIAATEHNFAHVVLDIKRIGSNQVFASKSESLAKPVGALRFTVANDTRIRMHFNNAG